MNTEGQHFSIGERVIALTTELSNSFVRIQGKEYTALDQTTCDCGRQYIDIGSKRNNSYSYDEEGECTCGKLHDAKGMLWHSSVDFVRIDDLEIEEEIEQMFKVPILEEVKQINQTTKCQSH